MIYLIWKITCRLEHFAKKVRSSFLHRVWAVVYTPRIRNSIAKRTRLGRCHEKVNAKCSVWRQVRRGVLSCLKSILLSFVATPVVSRLSCLSLGWSRGTLLRTIISHCNLLVSSVYLVLHIFLFLESVRDAGVFWFVILRSSLSYNAESTQIRLVEVDLGWQDDCLGISLQEKVC